MPDSNQIFGKSSGDTSDIFNTILGLTIGWEFIVHLVKNHSTFHSNFCFLLNSEKKNYWIGVPVLVSFTCSEYAKYDLKNSEKLYLNDLCTAQILLSLSLKN